MVGDFVLVVGVCVWFIFVFVFVVRGILVRSNVGVMHNSLFMRIKIIQLRRMRHFSRDSRSFLFIGVTLVFVEA